MESDGCSPLRIFPHAAITSDVFIQILFGRLRKRSMRQPRWKTLSKRRLSGQDARHRRRVPKTLRWLNGLKLKAGEPNRGRGICGPPYHTRPARQPDTFWGKTDAGLRRRTDGRGL